jgi:hypothetical protein
VVLLQSSLVPRFGKAEVIFSFLERPPHPSSPVSQDSFKAIKEREQQFFSFGEHFFHKVVAFSFAVFGLGRG